MKRRMHRRPTMQRPRGIPELRAARPRTVLVVLRVAELSTVRPRTLHTGRLQMLRMALLRVARTRALLVERMPVPAVPEAGREVPLLREHSPVIRRPRVVMKYMPRTVA